MADTNTSEASPLLVVARRYPDYPAAAKGACAWVQSGREKVDENLLGLHRGETSKGPGQVIGTSLQTLLPIRLQYQKPTVTYLIVLSLDKQAPGAEGGLGIHFMAVNLSNPSEKLAAIIEGTPDLPIDRRTTLYDEYIAELQWHNAQYIWNWWKTSELQ
ncbi:hypothetical protein CERSUDRAFT_77190 [Gelatoporia subvermispora B]|uniref:Uncharacterized protein n=1 Tax=Ceriporiopsis subvermispora (strain B) TaxID=914234 RepID=M2QL01_CERS8|nr:hypothetical protein CERSUDRAFT_77190 [Gelatoporia subvermispora B]